MRWLCLVLVLMAVAGARGPSELGVPLTAARGEHVALRLGDTDFNPRETSVRLNDYEVEVSSNDYVLVFQVPLDLEEQNYELVLEDASNRLSIELAVRGEVAPGMLFVVLPDHGDDLEGRLSQAFMKFEKLEDRIFAGLSSGFRLVDGAEPRRLIVPLDASAESGEPEFAEQQRANIERLQGHASICSEEGSLALIDVGGAPLEEAVLALRQVGFLTDKQSVGHLGADGATALRQPSTMGSGTFSGHDVTIAVLDTGVSPHEDFGTRLLASSGHDFVMNGPDSSDRSPTEHGTTVARLAAGAAPDALILPVQVCDETGRCFASDVLLGICHALTRAPQGPEALVINLSLGGPVPAEPLRVLLEHAASELGVLTAASAGNYGPNGPRHYPAAYSHGLDHADGLVAVSALVGEEGAWAPWSHGTRGDYIDLAAPGAAPGSGVGTSFATGRVAGALALWRQALAGAPAADVEAQLIDAARLQGVPGYCQPSTCPADEVGAGMIDLLTP